MFSVALHTNYCGWSTEQERKRHTQHTETEKECVKLVCLCVINCQEESWAACSSGQNSALPGPVSFQFHCLRPWLPSVQAIPTHPFSSSAATSMGENSPAMYSLQCSFLKTGEFSPRVIWYMKYVCLLGVLKLNFIKRTQSFASTRGWGGGGGGVVDKVMKFPFSYSNIYLVMNFKMYLWVKSPEVYAES